MHGLTIQPPSFLHIGEILVAGRLTHTVEIFASRAKRERGRARSSLCKRRHPVLCQQRRLTQGRVSTTTVGRHHPVANTRPRRVVSPSSVSDEGRFGQARCPPVKMHCLVRVSAVSMPATFSRPKRSGIEIRHLVRSPVVSIPGRSPPPSGACDAMTLVTLFPVRLCHPPATHGSVHPLHSQRDCHLRQVRARRAAALPAIVECRPQALCDGGEDFLACYLHRAQ